jgi:hypothetical protein
MDSLPTAPTLAGGNRHRRPDVQERVRSVLLVMALTLPVSACFNAPSPGPGGTLVVHAEAGPVCPVETVPPDPDCAPRRVAGAPVVISPADGRDVVIAQGETDADGMLRLSLAPDDYVVTAGDVEGLFGRPEAVLVSISAGETTSVTLTYDTGIR